MASVTPRPLLCLGPSGKKDGGSSLPIPGVPPATQPGWPATGGPFWEEAFLVATRPCTERAGTFPGPVLVL